jgi:hypothetical protein
MEPSPCTLPRQELSKEHNLKHLGLASAACAIGPSVITFSTDFSFQNLVFWNLFEFSGAEIT